MVLDVAITPEMWSLRRWGSLMQGDLAASFARGGGVEVTAGVTLYTYASDAADAWITLSAFRTRLRTWIQCVCAAVRILENTASMVRINPPAWNSHSSTLGIRPMNSLNALNFV